MHSVRIELAKLILVGTRITYQATGEAGTFLFFFKQKTAYEIGVRLVGSEMCIRDRYLY